MKRQKKISSGGHGRVLARQKSSEVMNEKEKRDRLEAASVLSSLMYLPPKSADEAERSADELEPENQSKSRLTYIPSSLSGNPMTAPPRSLKTQSAARRGSGTPNINSTASKVAQNAILARLQNQLNCLIKVSSKAHQKPTSPLASAPAPTTHPKYTKPPCSVPSVVLNAATSKQPLNVNPTKTINKDVASALRQAVKQTKRNTEQGASRPRVSDSPICLLDDEATTASPSVSTSEDAVVNGGEKSEAETLVKKESTDTNLPLKKRRLIGVSEQNGDAASQPQNVTPSSLLASRLPSLTSAAHIENILQMARDYPEVMIGNSSRNFISNLASQKRPSPTAEGYRPVQFDPRTSLMVLSDVKYALTPDEDGDLPLHMAVVHEDLELVKKYIDIMAMSGKKVDRFNKLMQTPLHLAVLVSNPTIIAELLRAGADPNLVDRHGRTAIHLAVQKGFHNCLEIVFGCTLYRPEVNGRDFNGYPALHTCVENNDVNSMMSLKKWGADLNVQDGKAGRSVLFYATEYNRVDMVDILLGWGANAEIQNYAGVSAYMTSQAAGYEKISAKLHQALEGKFTPDLVLPPTKKMAIPKFPSKVSLINPDIFNQSRSNSVPMDTSSGQVSRRSSISSSPMDLTMARSTSPGEEFVSSFDDSVISERNKRDLVRAMNRSVKEKHSQLVAALEGRKLLERPPAFPGQHGKVNRFNKSADIDTSALNIDSMTLQDLITKAQSEKNIQFLNQLNEHIVHRIEAMKSEANRLKQIKLKRDKDCLLRSADGVGTSYSDRQLMGNIAPAVEELDALPSDSGSVAVSVSLEDGVTVDVHIKEEQVEQSEDNPAYGEYTAMEGDGEGEQVKEATEKEHQRDDRAGKDEIVIEIKDEPMDIQEIKTPCGNMHIKDQLRERQHESKVADTLIEPTSPEMPTLSRAVSFSQDMDEVDNVIADMNNSGVEAEESLPDLHDELSAADKTESSHDSDVDSSQGSKGFECSKAAPESTTEKTPVYYEQPNHFNGYIAMEVDDLDNKVRTEIARDESDEDVILVSDEEKRTRCTEKEMEIEDSDQDDENPLVIDENPLKTNRYNASSKLLKKSIADKTKTKSVAVSLATGNRKFDLISSVTNHSEISSVQGRIDSKMENIVKKNMEEQSKDRRRTELSSEESLKHETQNKLKPVKDDSFVDKEHTRSMVHPVTHKDSDSTSVLTSGNTVEPAGAVTAPVAASSKDQKNLDVDKDIRKDLEAVLGQSSVSPATKAFSHPSVLKSATSKLLAHPAVGNKPVRILVDKSKKTEAFLNKLLAASGPKKSDIFVGKVPVKGKVSSPCNPIHSDTHPLDSRSRIVSSSKDGQPITTMATVKQVKEMLDKCLTRVVITKKNDDKHKTLQSGKVSTDSSPAESSLSLAKDKTMPKTGKGRTNGETGEAFDQPVLLIKSPKSIFSGNPSSSLSQAKKTVKVQSKIGDVTTSESSSLKSLPGIPQVPPSSGPRKTMAVAQGGRGPTASTEGTLTRVNPDIRNKLSKALQSPQRRLGLSTQSGKSNEVETTFPNFQGLSASAVTCAGDSAPTRVDSRQQL